LKSVKLSTFIGYGISGLMGIVGILVLMGVLAKEGTPVQLQMLFGIVLILYSVYRFTMTRARHKQEEGSEE
jgi:hypothetical protein